ncbi:MAG TPA: hypothetical protein VFQ35_10375 [Polyangiaceae bacterium]|nr:hypothetical protein [Polyangiaceae bacterium]
MKKALVWARGLAFSRAARAAFAFVVLAFCAAPVPGDVGGCNQSAEELDPVAFFRTKARIDCDQCTQCGISTAACSQACQGSPQTSFPKDCLPLAHDGEVCLRALLDAGCGDYAEYVRDQSPTVPTECNFCPEVSK